MADQVVTQPASQQLKHSAVKCAFCFTVQVLFELFMLKNDATLCISCLLFVSNCNQNWNGLMRFSKTPQYQ